MTTPASAIVFSIVALLIILKLVSIDLIRKSVKRKLVDWEDGEAFPSELRGGEIFLNEAVISCKSPVPLHGKCDQVFKLKGRKLVIVDTKTRKHIKVYPSDIIQTSAYKLMLEEKYGKRYEIADYAFIRVCQVDEKSNKERVTYKKAKLLNKKEMVALYKRHQKIVKGKVAPRCSCDGLFH